LSRKIVFFEKCGKNVSFSSVLLQIDFVLLEFPFLINQFSRKPFYCAKLSFEPLNQHFHYCISIVALVN